jgi:hypothetical protein
VVSALHGKSKPNAPPAIKPYMYLLEIFRHVPRSRAQVGPPPRGVHLPSSLGLQEARRRKVQGVQGDLDDFCQVAMAQLKPCSRLVSRARKRRAFAPLSIGVSELQLATQLELVCAWCFRCAEPIELVEAADKTPLLPPPPLAAAPPRALDRPVGRAAPSWRTRSVRPHRTRPSRRASLLPGGVLALLLPALPVALGQSVACVCPASYPYCARLAALKLCSGLLSSAF